MTYSTLTQAQQGNLPIIELFQAARDLAADGQRAAAIALYRTWLQHTPSPLAYAALFNLGVLLSENAEPQAAEAAYRAALEQHPHFLPVLLNLALLLESGQRTEEAIACWRRVLEAADQSVPEERVQHQHALDSLARLQPAPQPPAGDATLPLVSILLPTHNRPDLAEMALRSALAQTYAHIEIVVTDNSDDDLTLQRFAPYVEQYPQLRYIRSKPCGAMENFQQCYALARGEYINFLMDDDLLHPEKIAIMATLMHQDPKLGLVTSTRQLIDLQGNHMAAPSNFAPAFDVSTRINGAAMGAHVVNGAGNMIGEPTTVLFRKAAVGPRFGEFLGRQYTIIPDILTWLTILRHYDCVYLVQPLSYFRIHEGQGQRVKLTQLRGFFEWAQAFVDACEQHCFIEPGEQRQQMLRDQLMRLASVIGASEHDILNGGYDPAQAAALCQQTAALLLQPAAGAG